MTISPKPAIILAAIVAIISALLIVTYNATYVDTSGILTDKQTAAALEIYGGSAEDFSVVPESEWRDILSPDINKDFSEIIKVIRSKDGSLAFESSVKGYKKGFDILVGVKDGKVVGAAIVSAGEETPGLGTKTNSPEFLSQFKGKSGSVSVVKTTPANDNEIQAVTSATFSSKGVTKAVNNALKAAEIMPEYNPASTTGGER